MLEWGLLLLFLQGLPLLYHESYFLMLQIKNCPDYFTHLQFRIQKNLNRTKSESVSLQRLSGKCWNKRVKVWDHLVLVREWWAWCGPCAKWFPPNVTLCQGTEQSPVLSVRNACNCVRSGWPRDLPPVLRDGKLSSGWFSLFGNMLQIFLAF